MISDLGAVSADKFDEACATVYDQFRGTLFGTLKETMRVLKRGGRLIIHPSPLEVVDREREFLDKNCTIKYEVAEEDEPIPDFRLRTILTKL